jgi:AcrR family transcriptional regulator
MVRLTRAQQQARTRAAVLDAAVEEFAEHGYADAKIDRIAARAELTRGAVYSNFAGKRSLYLAVLLDYAPSHAPLPPAADMPGTIPPATAAEGFARAWLEHLPLAGDTAAGGRLRSRSVTGVFDDEPGRAALTEITRLEALLLALALESCPPVATRRVRLAELILTLLHGADHLAGAAPGFGDLFDVTRACGDLARLAPADEWDPPHLPFVRPAQLCDAPWEPADGVTDDGLLVILGTARLSAAEEAVRAAGPDDRVTVAVVSGDPAETGALVRLRLTGMTACLRRAFPPGVARPVHIELDDGPALAAAVAASFTADGDSPAFPPPGSTGGTAATPPPTSTRDTAAAQPQATPGGTAATPPPTSTGGTTAAQPPTLTGGTAAERPTTASFGFVVGDDTEIAVRIRGGRIVARAWGRGAGHAVAVALRAGGAGQP